MLTYEWDVETVDEYGDIEDHYHSERITIDHLDAALDKSGRTRLVLVRDDHRHGGIDRSWAYVEEGKLPDHFKDAYDRNEAKVPQRFHKELAKAFRKPPLIPMGIAD